MSDFIWPSDAARAENDELNRVCNELEDVMAQAESDEQMANIYRVENIKLIGERDALAADSRDLQLRNSELLTELAEAREREQTLSAYVERLETVFRRGLDSGDDHDLDAWEAEAHEVLATTPTTSLARLKAEWCEQHAKRFMELADNARTNGYMAQADAVDDMAQELKDEAEELRRQAEEGEHERF